MRPSDVTALMDRAGGHIDAVTGRITDIRRDIHRNPETGFNEYRTAGVVEAFLDEMGIQHRRCAKTGVVAVIGNGDGPVVALRADMDALAMPDRSGLPHASATDGVSHACGHDGHVAMLLGAAYVLRKLEQSLGGRVVLIWQPSEERNAGADSMVRDGALDSPRPDAIFAVHGWPGMPVGQIGYRPGPTLAATDNFEITVEGQGAHGAMPHTGIDPVTIAARVVEGLQLVRSRMIDPLKPAILTIGTIEGGSAVNVIPDRVVMTGTIRTLEPTVRDAVVEQAERMATLTAQASGGSAEFRITESYLPTINSPDETLFARDTLTALLGADMVAEVTEPVMGGEDFAYYLREIPGSFLRLGIGDTPPLHNPAFDFNDGAIPHGIRVLTGLAVAYTSRKRRAE